MNQSGKLTNDQLQQLILSNLGATRDDVVLRPGIGVDCGAFRAGDETVVMSTDPITAASEDAGRLAVLVSLNDIAASGAEPVCLLLTVMAPPGTPLERLATLVRQAQSEAAAHNVEIIGGHTEFTDAVNRVVLSTTAVGKTRGRVFSAQGGRAGDDIVVTKYAGLEGTAIIAADCPQLAARYITPAELAQARALSDQISVVREGAIASRLEISAMHDVTEGGVLGAAWELASAAGLGLRIVEADIPVLEVTRKLCAGLQIDPLRLIASGCLLIAGNGPQVVQALQAAGIPAATIGRLQAEGFTLHTPLGDVPLAPPDRDELYKVL